MAMMGCDAILVGETFCKLPQKRRAAKVREFVDAGEVQSDGPDSSELDSSELDSGELDGNVSDGNAPDSRTVDGDMPIGATDAP